MVVWVLMLSRFVQHLLYPIWLLLKNYAVALLVKVDCLAQRVDNSKVMGQQCMASGSCHGANKLLITSDCQHSWEGLLGHQKGSQGVCRTKAVRNGLGDICHWNGYALCTRSAPTQSTCLDYTKKTGLLSSSKSSWGNWAGSLTRSC